MPNGSFQNASNIFHTHCTSLKIKINQSKKKKKINFVKKHILIAYIKHQIHSLNPTELMIFHDFPESKSANLPITKQSKKKNLKIRLYENAFMKSAFT